MRKKYVNISKCHRTVTGHLLIYVLPKNEIRYDKETKGKKKIEQDRNRKC